MCAASKPCGGGRKEEAQQTVQKNEAHFTPAVSIVIGLREVIRMLQAEGLPNVFKRHDRLARATRAGVEALGLELFCKAELDTVLALAALEQVLADLGQPVDFGAGVRAAQKVFAEKS